ncbi:MAG: hypothetical protein M5U28_02760 [Sandaracinaceae bacterium]|nr:hypothetical protein [Sandaracinaceae bacterium]
MGNTRGECMPAGAPTHGQRCDGPVCAPGHHCLDLAFGDVGPTEICRRNCTTDADCPGTQCRHQILTETGVASGTFVCAQACDLVTQTGCPEGTGCHPLRDDGGEAFVECISLGSGARGAPCTVHGDCLAGTICVYFGETAPGRCARICRVGSYCGASRCVSLLSPIVVDGVEYGVCP